MQKRHERLTAGVVLMLVVSVALLGVMLAGCAPTRLEIDYGNSYRLATAQQVLLPESEQNLMPQEGLDGRAAQLILEHYRKTFEQPPPPPTFAISVGAVK
jgi:hypothetical protein